MEITHTRFRIIKRFGIDAFPERVSVTYEIKRVAFAENAIAIAVVHFDGQFKKLVRVAKLCARSHIRECIRRSAIKTNFFNRDSAQTPASDFIKRIIDSFVADRIHSVFTERRYSRGPLVPDDKLGKLHHVVDFGRSFATQGRNGSAGNAELGRRFRIRYLHQSTCTWIPATYRSRGEIDFQAESLTESHRISLFDVKRHAHVNHP